MEEEAAGIRRPGGARPRRRRPRRESAAWRRAATTRGRRPDGGAGGPSAGGRGPGGGGGRKGGAGGRPGLTQLRRRAGELRAPKPGSYSRATPRRGARSGPAGPAPAPMGALGALAPPSGPPPRLEQGGARGWGAPGPGATVGGAVGCSRRDWVGGGERQNAKEIRVAVLKCWGDPFRVPENRGFLGSRTRGARSEKGGRCPRP